MAFQTIAHLAWRFRMWYRNKRLLAAIAAPPLREIGNQLSQTTRLSRGTKRPFVIYSCHDIVSAQAGAFRGFENWPNDLDFLIARLDYPRNSLWHWC